MNGKLRALALLALLAALLALGLYAYPRLSERTQREAAATDAPPAEAQTERPAAAQEPEETAAPQKTSDGGNRQAEVFGPMPKRFAPDFTYYDADGTASKLSDLRGMPVIVNCFASWCGPCRGEMPHFDAAIDEYDGRIRFLMLDINAFGNDKAEDALAMVEELGLTFDVVFDTDGEAAGAYGIRAFPTTLFIASDGELVDTQIGAMTREMLSQGIERLLAAEE